MKILSVKVVTINDPDADLSWLGKFSSEPESLDPDDISISHEGGRNSFPFFHASNCSNPDEAFQNYARACDYGNGWYTVGVMAKATIIAGGIRQEITSGGLWGIESDSGDAYYAEVAGDEFRQLKGILEDLNGGPVELPELEQDPDCLII